jgi:hypothetical protein
LIKKIREARPKPVYQIAPAEKPRRERLAQGFRGRRPSGRLKVRPGEKPSDGEVFEKGSVMKITVLSISYDRSLK